jgi:hypothetical protein
VTLSARYIAGPYEGVSQAPPQVRLEGACEVMEDCLAVIPMGIQKRPPLTWFSKLLSSGVNSDCLFMEIPRGSPSTDTILLINNDGGNVTPYLFLTETGESVALTVTSAAQTYLNENSPTPNVDLKAVSVEDVTFITNRTVTVADSGSTNATRPYEAMVWVQEGGYARQTTVSITSTAITIDSGTYEASYTSGPGTSSNDPTTVSTDVIAAALYSGADPPGGAYVHNPNPLTDLTTYGFTVTCTGSLIYLTHPTDDFTITVTDDAGGTAVTAIKESVQNFSDLPMVAVNGFVVEIAQSAAGGYSDYYTTTGGVWNECLAPGVPLGLDPTTMPLALTATVSGGTTSWVLDTGAWLGRQVGDATLSPDPAFVGDQITDIKWWKGRPLLIFNGGAQLNASDNPYKCYATTLAAQLDSDPIAYLTPVERKSFFKQAITFDQRNAVFADKAQGIISTAGAVTPENTRMDTLATLDFLDAVPVQDSNHRVYFAATTSAAATIHELAIDRLSGLALIEEMTTAVPTYLPTTLDRATTHQTYYITVYGTSGASRLFIHCYRYQEQQRVQNAFYAWNLPSGYTLGGIFFKMSILYVILVDASGAAHYVQADVAPDMTDSGGTLQTYLDLRLTDGQVTSTTYINGQTTFTLPIPVTTGLMVTRRTPPASGATGNAAYPEAYVCQIASQTSTTVTLNGDWRSVPLWFGYPFASYFIPTQWYFLDQNGKPVHTGRLSMRRLDVDVSYAGYLRTEVRIKGRGRRKYVFEGVYLDDPETPMDSSPDGPETTTLKVPLGGSSQDTRVKFISDTHLGFKMVGYEWHGDFNPKARRVN